MKRKGAKTIKDVSLEIKTALEAGTLATANLTEWLAVDLSLLLQAVFTQIGLQTQLPALRIGLEQHSKDGVLKKMRWIGKEMAHILSAHPKKEIIFGQLASHLSDIVRCWAAFSIEQEPALNKQLMYIFSFAADSHFGVRECAWMAVRPAIANDVGSAVALLASWVKHDDFRIRRFAIESTRPRGVWCKHINQLKQNPELGLSLLEQVRSDKDIYVQDSVANWLNDASKSQPAWVEAVCHRWCQESNTPATNRIVHRALRTLTAKAAYQK